MNAEFNWWLLLVGVVAGAALTWLVLAELARRDDEVEDRELAAEATWIARETAEEGAAVEPEVAERVLRAHRRYLGLPPPDALLEVDASPAPAATPRAGAARPPSDDEQRRPRPTSLDESTDRGAA